MTIASRFRKLTLLLAIAGLTVIPGPSAHASVIVTQTATEEKGTPASAQSLEKKEAVDENDAYLHSPMVQKLGKMMGMSTETASLTFILINFAVLALALIFALVKTLPKTFRSRTAEIQKHLIEARTATEEASARLSGVEERLAKLDGQIVEMRAQAEKDAVAEEQRMRAAVDEEKTRILASAEQEIASASMQAQKALQRYAAELAIEQAARKLVVSAETDRLLVQGFARRLAGDDSTGGQN